MTRNIASDGDSEKEIQDRYRNCQFPNTESLGAIGRVITKCWQGKYTGCEAVVRDLQDKCKNKTSYDNPKSSKPTT